MRIACVGGGPGGVFFATMAKQLSPSHEVVVFERNRADDTFGFGVVFSDATLSNLGAADPVLRNRLGASGKTWDQIEMRLKGETLRCGGNGMAAIARKELLRLLYQRASEVGVDLRFQTVVSSLDQLRDFDLIVASDGANSLVRSEFADSFEPVISRSSAKFIWFGTTYQFNGLTFLFEESEHGVFAVHGYPLNDSMGTFIVETDEHTWLRAGMNRFDVTQPPGPSDMVSKDYLQALFATQTNGSELLVNNSRWANFRTIKNRGWRADNCVLLGDSAHTAHFSVGSGTKMAMEDAASLAVCISNYGEDLDAALDNYEQERRPLVEDIQASAEPSLAWWENFGKYYSAMEPPQFGFHFLTRAISGDRVNRRDPRFFETVMRWWRKQVNADPLTTPFHFPRVTATSRIMGVKYVSPYARQALVQTIGGLTELRLQTNAPELDQDPFAAIIEIADSDGGFAPAKARLIQLLAARPMLVAICGGSRLQRTLLAEEARLYNGVASMIIDEVFDKDQASTSILSGRCDFVGIPVSTDAEFGLLMA
ncbi:MAG: 2-polyprenyl-6-methoxyphenol hydroxylase [Acidimicrobiaceae bacterium]|nr:2-polyprenyl-6-methoxyphenol hydroxylase [Acidimicrobiaceae bacterium]